MFPHLLSLLYRKAPAHPGLKQPWALGHNRFAVPLPLDLSLKVALQTWIRVPQASAPTSCSISIARSASINTRATSGLVNSTGGTCPTLSISRTFVPESVTCSAVSCGHVLFEAIAPHDRQ